MAGLTASEYRGQGAVVMDAAGKEWLDFGSFGVHLLGHCHPAIVQAAREQLEQINLSTKILANEPILRAAEKLAALKSEVGVGVSFANSGSEAVEIAIKMCRLATGRSKFVALLGGYHGRTDGALMLSSSYRHHQASPPSNDIEFVGPNELDRLEDILRDRTTAAVFVEPIQGEGGIRLISMEFMSEAALLCQKYGTLFVSDEIQTGLGRSGEIISCPWADIIIFGKTLAGGVIPVTAVVFAEDKIGNTGRDPIVGASSYAGSALAGAVANSVLTVVLERNFIRNVNDLSNVTLSAARAAFKMEPLVKDVRGRGLMIGIELTEARMTGELILEAATRGLLVTFCLSDPAVVRIYPPAVASHDQVTKAIGILEQSLFAVRSKI
ncbi:aspartate aminotransferase family protein [Rhizobium leguminosarum]